MKTTIPGALFMASPGAWASHTMPRPTVYVPLGEAGEVMVMDAADDVSVGRISGLPAVHGLAGTPGWGYLVAGRYDERPAGAAALPPTPATMPPTGHEATHV